MILVRRGRRQTASVRAARPRMKWATTVLFPLPPARGSRVRKLLEPIRKCAWPNGTAILALWLEVDRRENDTTTQGCARPRTAATRVNETPARKPEITTTARGVTVVRSA